MKNKSQGFALIESLISVLLISLGLLAIIGVQIRTMVDSQTGLRRAEAVRLIEDLSERIKTNPNALAPAVITALTNPTAGVNCVTNPCTAAQLASYDALEWRARVLQKLPLGNAVIFRPNDEAGSANDGNRRQLGVLISWLQNEKTNDADYTAPFQTDATSVAGATCPANRICHLQYIQLSARCSVYELSDPLNPSVYCAR